ncbi:5-hydroxytryptamine receptor 3A-like [Mugil cephalus]|uniref:5-hydroxytryptamine receptor 3A-like n=1 Tax=Mugil cephalus TaxID=48193 RepID=UPI001FB7D303|nr:5-hydroxytryptamine receptor 3A-like [Mugil cephalus]
MSRPVKDYRSRTKVAVRMVMNGILDVKEAEQVLIIFVWIRMAWHNEFLLWNATDFCGLERIYIDKQSLWKPDVLIEETLDKNKAPTGPYLQIKNDGWVSITENNVVISACRMDVYRFPFDIQSCNISFKSIMYRYTEIESLFTHNNTLIMKRNTKMIRTQFEWWFLNMSAINETDRDGFTRIVYTITMKRRPALYIVNFLLPVLFFLCLDLASLLISDTSGEKLSYKITVLLAVTLMQILLNEILPSSDNIPLICKEALRLTLIRPSYLLYMTKNSSN